MRKRRWTGAIVLGLVVIGLLAVLLDPALRSGIIGLMHVDTLHRIRAMIRALGAWGPVLIIALMVVHSVTFVPAEILSIASVILFGPVWGVVFAWIGAMLGASLAFVLARWIGRPIAYRFVPERWLDRFQEFFEREGVTGVLILRLIPLVSFNALNYGTGLTPMTWWEYLWTTGLGILPMEILIAMVYQSTRGEEYLIVGLTVVGLALLAGLIVRSKLHTKYSTLLGEPTKDSDGETLDPLDKKGRKG